MLTCRLELKTFRQCHTISQNTGRAIKAGDQLAAKQSLQGKKCQTVLDNGMGPERDANGNLLPPQPKFQIKSISAAEWEAYRAKHYGNANEEADKKQDKGKKGLCEQEEGRHHHREGERRQRCLGRTVMTHCSEHPLWKESLSQQHVVSVNG